jgi:outer membrane murein-binding lipoprotein Lpp
MKKGLLLLPLLTATLLNGCAAPPAKTQALHGEVKQLNQQVAQLTNQASALEQQNQLNSQSTQGAWLLPAANTRVELKSLAGPLMLSLTRIEPEANGTRALLTLRAAGDRPLQSLRMQVEWGALDAATGKPLTASALSQTIEVRNTLVPQTEQPVPLRLSGLSPQQLGYVRVHDVEPLTPTNAAPAAVSATP